MLPPLKPYKREFDYSYSFGVFPTLELLAHKPEQVSEVLLSSKGSRNEGVRKIEEMCNRRRIHLEINDKAVDRLAPMENAYAVGVFNKYSVPLSKEQSHVVLVNPSDMGNLGTIMRTMLGFGVEDLAIVRPAVDIFDPRVIRSSMGAFFQLRFAYFDSFHAYRSSFSHSTYPFMTDATELLGQADFHSPFSLVFGNESSGLPEEYKEVGTTVRIQQTSKIDSLSLPVAVSIALYEATKSVAVNL